MFKDTGILTAFTANVSLYGEHLSVDELLCDGSHTNDKG